MPPVSTTSLTSMVVTISRRSWWLRISGTKLSRNCAGKYSGSLAANASWSGRSLANTCSLSASLTWAIRVANSGEVNPTPTSWRRAISFSVGRASSSRLSPRCSSSSRIWRACTFSNAGALARLVPIRSFWSLLSVSTSRDTSSVIEASRALRSPVSTRALLTRESTRILIFTS